MKDRRTPQELDRENRLILAENDLDALNDQIAKLPTKSAIAFKLYCEGKPLPVDVPKHEIDGPLHSHGDRHNFRYLRNRLVTLTERINKLSA